MPDDIITPPRVIAIPSDRAWFDPRLVLAASAIKTYNITIDPSGTMMVLPANPNRYMLLLSGGVIGTATYAPWPDVSLYSAIGPINPGTPLQQLTLWGIGPIITQSWYFLGSGFDTIRIVETVRVPG